MTAGVSSTLNRRSYPRVHPRPSDSVGPADLESADLPRRRLNVILASAALILLSPLMVLIAILVKVTSRGPILYRQTRVGWDRRRTGEPDPGCRRTADIGGQPFEIYKFRTMRTDAEAASGAVWASANDPRVTLVGGILRKTRLDELPQLFNVLKGDMNIVGPRPERPSIFADLRREIDGYHVRQQTRPGITGLAQINQSYDSSVDDVRRKVDYDLLYIRQQSVMSDILIMARTVPVMLFRKGAR